MLSPPLLEKMALVPVSWPTPAPVLELFAVLEAMRPAAVAVSSVVIAPTSCLSSETETDTLTERRRGIERIERVAKSKQIE